MEPIAQLKIDTPEQIALEFPLAGIGSRFLGLAVDTVLQILLYALLFTGVALAGVSHLDGWLGWLPDTIASAVVILFLFCIYWGYFALFELYWNGQTPGKRLAGLRVIHQSGRPANAYEVIGRNLLRAVDSLPGIYAVGVVTMMLNRQNRRVGDFVAGTVVVHDRRGVEVNPDWDTRAVGGGPAASYQQIGADLLMVIETYLHRRLDLVPEVRATTAAQIAGKIKSRAALEPAPDQSVDDFLETVARQVRTGAGLR